MNHTVLGVFYFIAFSHALMLGISLLQRSRQSEPGTLLAIMILIMGYKVFEGGALYTGIYPMVVHGLDLLPAAATFFGPVFFLYVCKVTGGYATALRFWPLHFIPGVCLWLYNFPAIWRSSEAKITMWQQVMSSPENHTLPPVIVILLLSIKVQLGTYLWLSWSSIKRFEAACSNLRADNSKLVLQRLRLTAMALFALEAVWVLLFIAQQLAGLGTLSFMSDMWLLFVAAFVLALGYIGLQNPALVFDPEEQKLAESSRAEQDTDTHKQGQKDNSNVKYLHSALPKNTLNQLALELEKQLREQQLYLDDKLSLTKLAHETQIRSHTLSQVISQSMSSNFYKLINGYRVQHAQSLIDDPKLNWSLERIALESGFNNRVTFVKAFKEVMYCTPSTYKKNQRERQKASGQDNA